MNPPPLPPAAAGSHLWQVVFISFAVVLILFEMLRGWNRGIARQLARLGALIAAYFAAFFGGSLLVPFIRPYWNLPDPIVAFGAGGVLALLTYAIINGLGTLLFKRTRQYESGAARVLCGLGGALFGLFFGAFLVWVIVFGVRSLGTIADGQVRVQSASPAVAAPTGNLHAVDVRRRLNGEQIEATSGMMASLARLKNSLELGDVGTLVKKSDVVSSQTYDTLGKLGQVISNPENVQRFLSFPGAQQLTSHPRIVALRSDPEVAELIQQGRLIELLQNQHVIDALNDPSLTDQIRGFDLQRALDYSLQGR
jgi:hypothetical protein